MATAHYRFSEDSPVGMLVRAATCARASAGERGQAFGQIVARFQDMAFGVAFAVLGDAQQAEDAAQEAFLTAWRSLDNLREPEAFPGWFQQIVRTQCNRQTRGKKLPTITLEKVGDARADGETDPLRRLERNERDAVIRDALAALPEHERAATTLYYLGDYDQAEIAAFLSVPVTTVKKRIFSARKRLRDRMTPYMMEPTMDPTRPAEPLRGVLTAARPSNAAAFTRTIAFWTALEEGETGTVSALLAEDPTLATRTQSDGETPLHRAARLGHAEIVGELLKNGAGPNARSADGSTPLHALASGSTRIEIAERLLAAGAEVNAADGRGRTPVRIAALRSAPLAEDTGDGYSLADFLLSRGAAADLWTAAALDRCEEIARITEVDKEAVKRTEEGGETPLHIAARGGYRRTAKALLDAGAPIDAANAAGHTALQVALQPGRIRFLPPYPGVVTLLRERGAADRPAPAVRPVSETLEEPHRTAANGNAARLHELIAADPEAARRRDHGRHTPLHYAAAHGHANAVTLLLENGANPNAGADDGSTPLHRAAHAGHRAVVELLLKKGADACRTNFRGETPLHDACQTDDVQLVGLLLEAGAPVNAVGSGRETPLHAAAERGHAAVVKCLLERGADTGARNYWGGTPLHVAARQGGAEIVRLLLKAGADKTARDNWHRTPLHVAAWSGQPEAAAALLDAGVSVSELSYGFSTPLHTVASAGHVPVAELLIARGADVNAATDFKRTPLHDAVQNGQTEMAAFLVAKGANPNAANDRGNTPLHWAAAGGRTEIVRLLLAHGADRTLKTQKDEIPADLAARHNHPEVAALLKVEPAA